MEDKLKKPLKSGGVLGIKKILENKKLLYIIGGVLLALVIAFIFLKKDKKDTETFDTDGGPVIEQVVEEEVEAEEKPEEMQEVEVDGNEEDTNTEQGLGLGISPNCTNFEVEVGRTKPLYLRSYGTLTSTSNNDNNINIPSPSGTSIGIEGLKPTDTSQTITLDFTSKAGQTGCVYVKVVPKWE